MKTLMQATSVNGTVISNNDPEMSIVLDPTPGVQISSIQDDSITYSFIGEVEQDTVYTPNLTFTYKGKHKVVVPLSFTHKVIAEQPYEISVEKIDREMIPAESNLIQFILKDSDGNPITNATKVSMTVTESQRYRFILAGWSNTLINMSSTVPGLYELEMNLGETAGTFTISLTVAVPDKTDSYVLEDLTYSNPGTPVNSTVTPNSIDAVLNKDTIITVGLTRTKYLEPDAPANGRLNILTIDGPATSITPSPLESSDGNYELTVKSNGVVGEINVVGEFYPIVNSISWNPVPVSFKLNAVAVPTVTDATTDMSLNLWEKKAVEYKVMIGDADITSSSTLTYYKPLNDSLDLVELGNGKIGFQAIAADSLEDKLIPVEGIVEVTHEGKDYTLSIMLDITILANTSGLSANRFNVDFV